MKPLRSLLDTALDRTVVPGYTKLGYWARRTGWDADDPRPGSMKGKRVLVTGASSGLGQAAAEGLARLGATVHLLVRNEDKGRAVVDGVRADVPGADVHLVLCDVSDLADVRRFADDFASRVDRLDVLVHNAGSMPPERTEAPGGHELTVALHVLGPLLMTELLLPVLRGHDARVVLVTSGGMYTQRLPVRDPDYERGEYRGTIAYARSKRMQVALHVLGPLLMTELLLPVMRGHDARVVLVTSGGMYTQRLPVRDPDYERGEYRGTIAYARSKRMQVALAPLMQQRWAGAGLGVHVMHPGWADTPGVATSLPVFKKITGPLLRDTEQGADTVVWLAATDPQPEGGKLWMDRAERPAHYRKSTRESAAEREQMWAWVLDAAGLAR